MKYNCYNSNFISASCRISSSGNEITIQIPFNNFNVKLSDGTQDKITNAVQGNYKLSTSLASPDTPNSVPTPVLSLMLGNICLVNEMSYYCQCGNKNICATIKLSHEPMTSESIISCMKNYPWLYLRALVSWNRFSKKKVIFAKNYVFFSITFLQVRSMHVIDKAGHTFRMNDGDPNPEHIYFVFLKPDKDPIAVCK